MANVLRKLGLDIGHHRLGKDGAIGPSYAIGESWFAPDAGKPFGFTAMWHQVRHPLATIGSLATPVFGRLWQFIGRHVELPDEPLLRAMRYWLEWNTLCEQFAEWRYRVEDIRPGQWAFKEVCSRLGLLGVRFPQVRVGLNHHDHSIPSWRDLLLADVPLTRDIAATAREYGYET